jgi:Mg-chelatase subunit ChlD
MKLVIGLFAISLSMIAIAQENSAPCRTTVSFSSFDDHWAPIDNLRADQVSIRVGHEPQAVNSLQRLNRPARIVFVLDGSGSMTGTYTGGRRWPVALQTMLDLVSSAPDGTQFGIVTVGGPGERQFDLTTDKQRTAESIRSLKDSDLKGKSPLIDAIARAMNMLTPSLPGDAVFLLTDGGDNSSKAAPSQLRNEVEQAHTLISGILFQDDRYRTVEEKEGPVSLQTLVDRSGGALYKLSDDDLRIGGVATTIERLRSLQPVWDAILYHPYTVDIQSADKPQSLTIALAHGDKRLKWARLAYARKVPACSPHHQVTASR